MVPYFFLLPFVSFSNRLDPVRCNRWQLTIPACERRSVFGCSPYLSQVGNCLSMSLINSPRCMNWPSTTHVVFRADL
ncbi:hypothetical protein F5X97DRAFT_294235 [Nemania serpens]|nr:hypothetical protein F5X97DRAFT_294235 [Nemania serpens]